MDVWKEYDSTKGDCMVQVPKPKQLSLERFCKSKKIRATKVIKDVKQMIDKNLKEMTSKYERFDYKRYNRYDAVSLFILEVHAFLKQKALLLRIHSKRIFLMNLHKLKILL